MNVLKKLSMRETTISIRGKARLEVSLASRPMKLFIGIVASHVWLRPVSMKIKKQWQLVINRFKFYYE